MTILIGFLLGFKDGLIRKIIGLIGLFVAIFVAYQYSGFLGKILLPIFNEDKSLSDIFAGILMFFIVVLLFSVIKRIVHPLDQVNKLLNQVLGGIAGVLQVLFFVSAVFLLLKVFNIPGKETKDSSMMYQKVYFIVPSTINFIFGDKSNTQDFIQQFIQADSATTEK